MLRAYSQNVFDPLKMLYENPSEDAFVVNVRPFIKQFIKENMGDDDDGIDREVCLTR
jgi:hypothetical protein